MAGVHCLVYTEAVPDGRGATPPPSQLAGEDAAQDEVQGGTKFNGLTSLEKFAQLIEILFCLSSFLQGVISITQIFLS